MQDSEVTSYNNNNKRKNNKRKNNNGKKWKTLRWYPCDLCQRNFVANEIKRTVDKTIFVISFTQLVLAMCVLCKIRVFAKVNDVNWRMNFVCEFDRLNEFIMLTIRVNCVKRIKLKNISWFLEFMKNDGGSC
jgi:hypothetical protein